MERPRLPIKILILVALVTEIVAGVFIIPRMHERTTHRAAQSGGGHHHNTAGYSFDPPSNWKVTDDQAVSEAKSPAGHALVVFAPIPRASTAADTGNELLTALRRSYDNFAVVARSKLKLGKHRAVLLRARGVSPKHVPVTLFAAAVVGETQPAFGVVSYWSDDATPAEKADAMRTARSLRV